MSGPKPAGPKFDRRFDPRYGEAVEVAPGVRRLTCRNPGPFTWLGTNSYIVGDTELAIVDPGPDDAAHVEALLAATGGRPIVAILVTHTHKDHSPAAAMLKRLTGAPTWGEGPHRPARPLAAGEAHPLDASSDKDFVPDHAMTEGTTVAGAGWRIEAVPTPGHTANHLAFALAGTDLIFSGDHVMGWSTSIVAPPDGAMADYMASLDRFGARPEDTYLPGHGGLVEAGHEFVDALRRHRKGRESAILDRLAAGDETIPDMVRVIYADVDRALHGAAALSVLAQIEDLVERGLVAADGHPSVIARFRLAG